MRRFVVAVSAGALALGAVAAAGVGPAAADAPTAQGWWWAPQSSSLPVSLPTPPTATADGLYVASDSTGAEAISAVRFTIPDGASTGSLTLKVSGSPVGTAVVGLCPTTGPWTPVQAGAWDAKPAFSNTGCSAGTVSSDGTSVTFATRSLVSGGLLDAAIVPVKDSSGNQPTFQLSLAKPDGFALTVTQASSADASSASPSSPAAAPAAAPAPASATAPSSTAGSPSVAPSFSSGESSAVVPAVGEQSSSSSADSPQGAELVPAGARRLLARPVSVIKTSGNRKYQTLGIIGLALLALVYTSLNNRPARQPRALVAFGQLDETDMTTEGVQS